MKKSIIIILSVIFILIVAFLGYNWFKNSKNNHNSSNNSEYNAIRTTTDTTNNIDNKPAEIELYSFSTPIKSDDKNRLTNLKITCSKINGTIVKSGKEFSFCDIVGQPNSKDGYKPADAFGSNGKIIKAIGGGNCQVSTTIYNAALGVNGLKVTERHEHDRDVAYIEDGKDATVAYDYLDLKFKNNNDFDIKLYSFISDNNVCVKIFRVS